MENYYSILGLAEYTDDVSKIRAAYLNKVKYYHPDAGNVSKEVAEEKTKELNAAYDTLKDPQKKAAYDEQLRYGFSSPYSSASSYRQGYSSYGNYGQTGTYGSYSQSETGSRYGQSGYYGQGSQYRQNGYYGQQGSQYGTYGQSGQEGEEENGGFESGWYGPFRYYYYSSRGNSAYGQRPNPFSQAEQSNPYGQNGSTYGQNRYDHTAPYGSRQNPYGQQYRYTYYSGRPRFSLWRIIILLFLVSRLASCVNAFVYYNSIDNYRDQSGYYQEQEENSTPRQMFENSKATGM